ncbi:hypothetical protein N8289_00840 [Flavobacteriales bacterium]|jgi:hypothetical protein|nr:hypothetical protein [Flavobacteriales bacterium]MDG1175468.1 hypothetical protein [Flavobacteriales bacterium]|tara:strand:- start:7 stop:357 length:351 start_codon:yes stop_codon:yes gene_type:complete
MKKEDIPSFISSFFKKEYKEEILIKPDEVKRYSYPKSNKYYSPDIEVKHSRGTDFICIEKKFKKSDIQGIIQKWILISNEARKQQGKLWVFTKSSEENKFQGIIDKLGFQADLQVY